MNVFQTWQLWLEEIHRRQGDVFTPWDVDCFQTLAVLHQEEHGPAGSQTNCSDDSGFTRFFYLQFLLFTLRCFHQILYISKLSTHLGIPAVYYDFSIYYFYLFIKSSEKYTSLQLWKKSLEFTLMLLWAFIYSCFSYRYNLSNFS